MLIGGLLGISSEDVADNLSDDEVTSLPPIEKDSTPSNIKQNNSNGDIEETMVKIMKKN